jgi:hypothetical protein
VSYRFEEGDFRFLLREARHRHLRVAVGAARRRARATHALFDGRDPLPPYGVGDDRVAGRSVHRATSRPEAVAEPPPNPLA